MTQKQIDVLKVLYDDENATGWMTLTEIAKILIDRGKEKLKVLYDFETWCRLGYLIDFPEYVEWDFGKYKITEKGKEYIEKQFTA